MCVGVLLVFFFFKQKTAYEMRISDWSSDVCSSDLTCSALLDPDGSWWVLGWGEMSAANFLISLGQTIDRSSSQSMTIIGMTAEIGRASCRERVCQYV